MSGEHNVRSDLRCRFPSKIRIARVSVRNARRRDSSRQRRVRLGRREGRRRPQPNGASTIGRDGCRRRGGISTRIGRNTRK